MKKISVKGVLIPLLMLSSGNLLASSNDVTEQMLQMKDELEIQQHPQILKPQIVTVADKVNFAGVISNQAADQNGLTSADSYDSEAIIIQRPEASFIKIHFSEFQIPAGSYIEVSDKTGNQVHRYGGDNESLKTTLAGDDGVNSFAALSIIGDTALIKYFAADNQPYKVVIDHFMQGYAEEVIEQLMQADANDGVGPLSTCGVNERRDVECWAGSHPTEYERTRPVARLLMNGSGLCTGWRVGDANHMFTNNHCVDTQSGLNNTEVWFNYQRSSCGGSSNAQTTIVTGNTLLKTDYTLDYTLFTVNNFSSVTGFGHFGLDVREAIAQEQIYIPQHGSGNPKELAIESDQNSGGLCRIDSVSANGRGTATDMGYMCDTIGGSSGSPVLASSSNSVIALHHFGGCENQGVKISRIWPQVSSHFGGVIPVGDNQTPNGDPIASFTYSANQLAVSFNNNSSDPDGSIVSQLWDFGDGNSSTQSNPSHTYAAAGTYNVSLIVTDNDANTNTKTQSVTVASTQQGELIKGVAVTEISGNQGSETGYWIDVPANSSNLTFTISGGSGDADLYVRFGAEPTTSSYDCRPYRNGNSETCSFAAPQAGRYYVMLRAYSSYSGVQLVADYQDATGGDSFEHTNLSGSTGNWKHYTLQVTAGAAQLKAVLSGGTGDADLYVRFGAEPTTSAYNCRPYRNGNSETCTINNPQVGTWYVSIRAYRTYSGVTLKGDVL
jgi:serine protease